MFACIVPSDADGVGADRYTLQCQAVVLMVRHIICGQANVRQEGPCVAHTHVRDGPETNEDFFFLCAW